MDDNKASVANLMDKVVELAIENARSGNGGPFAAAVVRDGKVVATGTNVVTTTNDPTAHAEIVAIRKACEVLGDYQLTGCDLYTSCEPCPMCLGAVYWARPENIYFAATRKDAAAGGFDDEFIYEEIGRPTDDRKIPMIHVEHSKASHVFDICNELPSKLRY